MRKSAKRSARRSKKPRRSKAKKHSLPAMFKIVPVRARAQPRRQARALTSSGPSPCPVTCTCTGTMQVGEDTFWVCVYPDGTIIYVRKN